MSPPAASCDGSGPAPGQRCLQTLGADQDRAVSYEGPRSTGLHSPGPSDEDGRTKGRPRLPAPHTWGARWALGLAPRLLGSGTTGPGCAEGPEALPGGAPPAAPRSGHGGGAATSEGRERQKSPLGVPRAAGPGTTSHRHSTHQAKVDRSKDAQEDVDHGAGSKWPGTAGAEAQAAAGASMAGEQRAGARAQRGPSAGPRGTVGARCAFATSDAWGTCRGAAGGVTGARRVWQGSRTLGGTDEGAGEGPGASGGGGALGEGAWNRGPSSRREGRPRAGSCPRVHVCIRVRRVRPRVRVCPCIRVQDPVCRVPCWCRPACVPMDVSASV